jgi:thiamine biosynthesis lipoprotein ApbE
MIRYTLDVIGTHLTLSFDVPSSHVLDEGFSRIQAMLLEFEKNYSRFLADNWLYHLNRSRKASLDIHTRSMLEMMVSLSQKTDGYFDPTIGTRLTEL